jgi:hypothetical protein
MTDYATIKLDQQLAMMETELQVCDTLHVYGEMWTNAKTELDEASASLESANNRVEPAWRSVEAKLFIRNNRLQVTGMKKWSSNIASANPAGAMADLAQAVRTTYGQVQANVAKAKQEMASAFSSQQAEAIERNYQFLNAGLMRQLDQRYLDAVNVLRKAASGDPTLGNPGGPTGVSPASSPSSPVGDLPSGADQAGGAEQAGGEQAGGEQQQAGADAAGAGGGATPGSNPGLAGGLGAAPTIPPPSSLPPLTPSPPMPGGGVPLVPMVPSAGLGAGPRGGGGGGGGGAARVPGVRVGGGAPSSIASAAVPVSSPATPAPAVAPGLPGGAGGTSGAPGGAIPPMIPPMGAGAMGAGSGGGPGSGAARRPSGPGRGRRDDSTPGLPAMLTGKAGKRDPHAFVARTRVAESDVPSTVQLIDEDLWQVRDQAPANDQVRRLSR